ncbi:TetR/AcrR family transcriptional regulator [Kibdelosporangium lantanae]
MARPADKALDQAIARATLELLGEVGFDRLSIAGVATRAKTARTSVYRRWPDKTALVVHAVRHSLPLSEVDTDTGGLRGDLLAQSRSLAARAEVVPGLVVAVRDNGELGALVRETIIERDRALMAGVVERAVARGEVRADVDEIVLRVPISMLFTRLLLLDGTLTDDYLVKLVDHVLVPLLGREPDGPRR